MRKLLALIVLALLCVSFPTQAMFLMPGERAKINPFPGRAIIKPFTIYGQQTWASTAVITNPTPSVNGLVGEITSLPYVVPAGYVLLITAYGIEANNEGGTTNAAVIYPWLGNTLTANSQQLMSLAASTTTNEGRGFRFYIPAGTKFNINLTITNPATGFSGIVLGWYVSGYLISPPSAAPLFNAQ